MTTNTISSTDKRWQEIKDIWKKDSWLYGLTGLVAGFIFGVAASSELRGFVLWFCQSFWTDTLSIAITVLVIDRLNRLRDREAYKQELFRQAKSRSNDFAVDALRQIQDNGWWGDLIEHYPSTSLIHFADLSEVQWAKVQLIEFDLQLLDLAAANLREANLVATNLQRANLRGANLQGAWLDSANLQHTRLLMSNLQHSRLSHANLQQTELENANLQQANLREANLQEAYLREANLQGVDLYKANLQETNLGLANLRDASLLQVNLLGAKIDYAQFDEKTLLPDAQKTGWDDEGNNLYTPKSYWTPKTDMRRYTDPEHPDFWEPDYLKSDYVLTGLEPQWIKDWHEKKED